MSWEIALRSRLLDDAAVAALVGARVTFSQRKPGAGLPALVLRVVSDPRPQTMGGFQQLRESRVQADCWAASRESAVALGEAVLAASVEEGTFSGVRFARGFIEARRDLGENSETGFVHRDSIDLLIWHE